MAISEEQRQWSRDNNIRVYYSDNHGPVKNTMRIASFSAPVDKAITEFGGDVEATIVAVIDETKTWMEQNQ